MSQDKIVMSLLQGANKAARDYSPTSDDPSVHGYTASVRGYSDGATSYVGGRSDFMAEHKTTPETIFAIGSCTKMFTAATMLRMTEHELYSDKFPEGVNTKLSQFVPALKERYPDSTFIQNIESQDHYEDITLRDLLQHTHGMGTHTATMDSSFIQAAYSDPEKIWSPSEVMDDKYIQKQWIKGNGQQVQCEYGKFTYSNAGYELAGMIIETAANEGVEGAKKYAEVVRDLVINPLGLKNTLMHDQVQTALDGGEKEMARGYIFHDDKFHEGKGFNHAFAAGGIHSTPEDLNKFTQAFLTTELDKSIFHTPETLKEMEHTVDQGRGDGSFYGLGFRNIGSSGLIGHPGGIQGFESLAAYDPKTKKSSSVIYANEELTSSMAKAVSKAADHTQNTPDERVLEVQKRLLRDYTPKELVLDREDITRELPKQMQVEQLDALDLATTAPISPELRQEARKIGTKIIVQPEENKNESKTNTEKMADLMNKNKLPNQSREI